MMALYPSVLMHDGLLYLTFDVQSDESIALYWVVKWSSAYARSGFSTIKYFMQKNL